MSIAACQRAKEKTRGDLKGKKNKRGKLQRANKKHWGKCQRAAKKERAKGKTIQFNFNLSKQEPVLDYRSFRFHVFPSCSLPPIQKSQYDENKR